MTPQDRAVLTCTLSRWQGERRRCRWCNIPFRYPRQRWCSDVCLDDWRRNHVWAFAQPAAKQRDVYRCQDCLSDPATRPGQLEVDHLEPCRGTRTASCLHHQENLRTRCQEHHLARHRELSRPTTT